MIPSSARKHKKARTLDSRLFAMNDENGSSSDSNHEDEHEYNISYYSSGAVSTNTVKPKIRKSRRAKSHINVNDYVDNYNYDSIWNVKSDQIIHENDHIDAMMDKPCVTNKRKSRSRNVNVNELSYVQFVLFINI